jgi:acetyl esterase
MSTHSDRIYEFDVEDVEYLRHGDKPFLVRLFKPRGDGPFPAMVELHGGAWSQFDRTRGKSLHEALARSGILVAALDFRQGPQGAYPLSVADVHYGIRWVKANAATLGIRADRVGLSGNSSGGHLAMLVAMRPRDPRYASIPLPTGSPDIDASVQFVVMLWPVINPHGRYRHAIRESSGRTRPEWAERIIQFHDGYWKTEENMKEGNPMLILERGETVVTPPAIWIQSSHDDVHNYHDKESTFTGAEADRFADRYRKAGGRIDVSYYDAPNMFITVHPTLPESSAALKQIVEFAHQHFQS